MKNNPNVLWISALILGWLFDFLFWGQSLGVNFTIYAALCVIGGLFLLRLSRQPTARGILWLIPPLLFFMAVPFVRTEPMTVFLSVLFTILLAGVASISYLGGRWFHYSLADYVAGFAGLFASMLARPIAFRLDLRREAQETGISHPRLNLWPIVRGIVIAIPILAVFAALLSSADAIFS